MKKVETINDEKILTISEEEFHDSLSHLIACAIEFKMLKENNYDEEFENELASDYGMLAFAFHTVLFDEGEWQKWDFSMADYSEEEE